MTNIGNPCRLNSWKYFLDHQNGFATLSYIEKCGYCRAWFIYSGETCERLTDGKYFYFPIFIFSIAVKTYDFCHSEDDLYNSKV